MAPDVHSGAGRRIHTMIYRHIARMTFPNARIMGGEGRYCVTRAGRTTRASLQLTLYQTKDAAQRSIAKRGGTLIDLSTSSSPKATAPVASNLFPGWRANAKVVPVARQVETGLADRIEPERD